MSSGEFSEKPVPATEKTCPVCGEAMSSKAEMCWLCLEEFSTSAAAPRQKASNVAGAAIQPEPPRPRRRTRSSSPVRETSDRGDKAVWVIVGVVGILLFAALAFETPGILMLLVIVATPLFARSVLGAFSKESHAASANALTGVNAVVSAVGIAVIVGLTFSVTFFATCFAVCYGGMSLNRLNERGELHEFGLIMMASVGSGIVAGGAVIAIISRRLWARKG